MRKPRLSPRFAIAFAFAFCAAAACFTAFHRSSPISPPARYSPLDVTLGVPQPAGVVPNPSASAHALDSAVALMRSGRGEDFAHAIEAYLRPAVALDPKSLRARALLAHAYLGIQGNLVHGEEFFRTVTALLDPGPGPRSNVPYEYVLARIEYLRMLGREQDASELANAAVRSAAHPELLFQQALSQDHAGDKAGALSTLGRALALDGENPRFRLYEAILLRESGKVSEFDAAIDRVATANPHFEAALILRAELRAGRKDFQGAAHDLNEAFRSRALDVGKREDAIKAAVTTLVGLGYPRKALEFAALLDGAAAIDAELGIRADASIREAREKLAGSDDFKALFALVKAVEADRENSLALTVLARAYEDRRETFEAIDRYKKAIASPRGHEPEAVYRLARIYLERYDHEALERLLGAATPADNADGRLEYLRALHEVQRHDPDAAEAHFRAALAAAPRFAPLYDSLGSRAAEHRDDLLAQYYYSAALRADPRDEEALYGQASALFNLESPSRAIGFLRARLLEHPNDASLLTLKAMIHLRAGDQLAGKSDLQNAIRANPRYAKAFLRLGDLVRDEGNRQIDYNAKRHSYRYALASFEMYSKLEPNDPAGYKLTADLYFDIRDLGAAAKNYHKVLELTPSYPGVSLRLAQIARNGGDIARAEELLRKEIQVDPAGCDAAWVELGNLNMARRDFDEAYRAFTEATRLNQNNADAFFGLGVVHHLRGAYDNALAVFARTQRLDPLKADIYWQQGLIYQKLRDRRRAIQAFVTYKGIVREASFLAKADEKIREIDYSETAPDSQSPGSGRGLASAAGPVIPLFERLHRKWLETDFLSGAPIAVSAPETAPSGAKRFANQFVEFEVPNGWECAKDSDAWICRSTDPAARREAVVVVSATKKDPGTDELANYQSHLERPRSYQLLSGAIAKSDPKFVKEIDIAGRTWIDSLHGGSEVPGFYTRYFATVEEDVGVGLAFTVRNDRFDHYGTEIDRIVKTLRAYRRARLEGNEKAENAPMDPAVPSRVIVEGRYEDLPPEQKKAVDSAYAGILAAFEKRDFATMKADTAAVLALLSDFKDTRSYEAIASRGLAALAEEKERQERMDRMQKVREEVARLEINGERVVACVEKHPEARDALKPVADAVYALDPNNLKVAQWHSRVAQALVAAALKNERRRHPKKSPFPDPRLCDAEKLAADATPGATRRPASTR